MLKLEGKIVTLLSRSATEDGVSHAVILVLGQKTVNDLFRLLEIQNLEAWGLDERVTISIESQYDSLLREQNDMQKELKDLATENAKFKFPDDDDKGEKGGPSS
jgi:hypothetical protein